MMSAVTPGIESIILISTILGAIIGTYEAAIIGIIGSVVGGILSLVAGYAISALMLNSTKYLFTIATAISVTEGVGFGIVICLACGLYPAWQAANMNPIDALRHE
jgi:putative ABC transport system permease protein